MKRVILGQEIKAKRNSHRKRKDEDYKARLACYFKGNYSKAKQGSVNLREGERTERRNEEKEENKSRRGGEREM